MRLLSTAVFTIHVTVLDETAERKTSHVSRTPVYRSLHLSNVAQKPMQVENADVSRNAFPPENATVTGWVVS